MPLIAIKPRPSAAGRWAGGCPGSVALAAQFPVVDHSEANDGIRLHGLAADVLQGKRELGSLELEDQLVVGPYVREVQKIFAEAGSGATLLVEHQVAWGPDGPDGTLDAAIISPRQERTTILDLKSGWRPIEAKENKQLLCYAAAIAQTGHTLDLRIVQPRPFHRDGSVRSWVLLPQAQGPLFEQLWLDYAEARRAGAPLRPGGHCLYCNALPGCPAARDVTLRAVEHVSDEPENLPAEFIGRELKVLQETLDLLKRRTDALTEDLAVRLRAGERIPGVALREGKGGKVGWATDDEVIRSVLTLTSGVDHAKAKMPTPKQLMDRGVPKELVLPLTEYRPGKLVVSTNVGRELDKAFGELPKLEKTQ